MCKIKDNEVKSLNTHLQHWFAVIQDVENASLEGQYQSFAGLMEQRLAELFVLAGRQGTRFRRAATVDSFTVQVRRKYEAHVVIILLTVYGTRSISSLICILSCHLLI